MSVVAPVAPSDLPASFRRIALGSVASTNDEARRLAGSGAADGTVVTAVSQSGGRGRLGRSWASPAGNHYASLIVRSTVPAARLPELSLVAALAVAEAVERFVPAARRVRLKWPNDVLVDGAKIAGILLERVGPEGVVVGVGINLASHPDGLPYRATDLAAAGVPGATVDAVLAAWLGCFARWRAVWERQGFGPVKTAWERRAAGLGERVSVDLGTGGAVEGRLVGLDERGALVLETAAGRLSVSAGDVGFVAGG